MREPTEADFDALWDRMKKKHDAKHGEGDAERLAESGMKMFGPALGIATSDEDMAESIRRYLARSLIKDDQKAGDGWRTAREIAHTCLGDTKRSLKVSALMQKAEDRGEVEIKQNGQLNYYRSTMSLKDARKLHPNYQP